MDILRNLSLASASTREASPSTVDRAGTVLTIGKFDGVHRGHRAVLERVVANAERFGALATVMTFDPHPRDYFGRLKISAAGTRHAPSPRVSSLRDTLRQIAACGIDRIVFQRFNAAFAGLTADAFIRCVLVEQLRVKSVLVGEDFRFGRDRIGDLASLTRAGHDLGFEVETISAVLHDNARISSSAVRAALLDADIGLASTLLGRQYAVSGWLMRESAMLCVRQGQQALQPSKLRLAFGSPLPLPDGIYSIHVRGLDITAQQVRAEVCAGQVITVGDESYRSQLLRQQRKLRHAPLRVTVEFLGHLSSTPASHGSPFESRRPPEGMSTASVDAGGKSREKSR